MEKYWSWVGGIVNVLVQMRGDSPGSTSGMVADKCIITRRQIALHLICISFQVTFFEENFREFTTLNALYEKIFKLPILIESRQKYY